MNRRRGGEAPHQRRDRCQFREAAGAIAEATRLIH